MFDYEINYGKEILKENGYEMTPEQEVIIRDYFEYPEREDELSRLLFTLSENDFHEGLLETCLGW